MLNYECRYISSHRTIHVPHSFAVLHLNGKTHYNQIKGYLAIFYTVLNKRWCSGSRTSQSILETFLFTDIYRPFQFTTPSTGTVTEVNKQPLCKWLGIHSHSRNFSVSSVLWGEGWHLCWIKVFLTNLHSERYHLTQSYTDSKRKFNFSVKALNFPANSPSAIHSKTPCQMPLVSALSSNWTSPGFPSANSIGIKQHLHFRIAASMWHFGVPQTLTDEHKKRGGKKSSSGNHFKCALRAILAPGRPY